MYKLCIAHLKLHRLLLKYENANWTCCCCCCLPSETYGRNGATPIFRSFFTELPVPPQAAGVVGTFNVLDIYLSEHYGLSFFGPYGCHFFYKVSFLFCFCIHFHFASTLCMCVMYLTSIWRIFLMTDGLNAVWSNDRAAPTDTNPKNKNLELAPPQSITATRLDQQTGHSRYKRM